GTHFQQLANGWYVVNKKSYETSGGSLYELVSLIPVKWSYYIQNKYLKNSFVAVKDIEQDYDISLAPTSVAVKDADGKKLFYLTQLKDKIISKDNIFSVWLKIFAGVIVLFFIHKLAK